VLAASVTSGPQLADLPSLAFLKAVGTRLSPARTARLELSTMFCVIGRFRCVDPTLDRAYATSTDPLIHLDCH
jgi:hypothetical protein